MAGVDIHLLIQTILYFCIFLCGFAISIPMVVNQNSFDGMCILYADFSKTVGGFRMTTSNKCDLPIFMFGSFCIVYGLALGAYYAFATRNSTKYSSYGSQMWITPFMFLNSAFAVLLLVVAPAFSAGFKQLCDNIKEFALVKSCKDYQNREMKNESKKFNTGYFYSLLTVAEIACWTAFFLFLLQIAFGMLRFYRNRRAGLRASDKENFATVEPTA